MFPQETRTFSRRVSYLLFHLIYSINLIQLIFTESFLDPFRILEAVSLFSVSPGAVVLLLEKLESGEGEQSLKDFHIESLPEEVVLLVLKKRLFSK